jgi:hypothetical protein
MKPIAVVQIERFERDNSAVRVDMLGELSDKVQLVIGSVIYQR